MGPVKYTSAQISYQQRNVPSYVVCIYKVHTNNLFNFVINKVMYQAMLQPLERTLLMASQA
jgi:hypothetical protein